MKAVIYYNYTSCVMKEVEINDVSEIAEVIESLCCNITDEDILDSIQEASVDYDILAEQSP